MSAKPGRGPITRWAIEAWSSQAPRPGPELRYEMPGPGGGWVRSNVEADRVARIASGERTLKNASLSLRSQMSLKPQAGYGRVRFNQTAKPMNERVAALKARVRRNFQTRARDRDMEWS